MKQTVATVAAGLAAAALVAAGGDLATRPALGADESDSYERYTPFLAAREAPIVHTMGSITLRDEGDYDMNAALRERFRSPLPDEAATLGGTIVLRGRRR